MIIEPTVQRIAMDIWAITEWFGFSIGVVALINPVIIQITIIPIKYPTTEIGPKNIVKNNHNKIYHAIDSENIMYPLSIPKCSVSNPDMISFPFVIAKAQSELHERILKKVGADSIIRPEKEMGTRIARSLVSGNFAAILPHLLVVLIYTLVITILAILVFLKQMKD